jgi:hypothetical protein
MRQTGFVVDVRLGTFLPVGRSSKLAWNATFYGRGKYYARQWQKSAVEKIISLQFF